MTAGLDVNAQGTLLAVVNLENDSISIIDIGLRAVRAEVDLRPGIANPALSGSPGGEFPFWVVIQGNTRAYVSSVRDREIVTVDLATKAVTGRSEERRGGKECRARWSAH